MDQSVKDAIAKLVADGKLTEEESREYFPDLVDKVEFLADALHLLMCKEKHNDNVTAMGSDDMCDYYVEQQLAEGDAKFTLMHWRDQAEGVIEAAELNTIDDVRQFVDAIGEFYESLRRFMKLVGTDGMDYIWPMLNAYI